MRAHPPNLPLRVLALVAVLANVLFNYTYVALGADSPDVRAISERYDNLFTPASYAFAIWGVIYVGLIGYAVLALLPRQSRIALHDRIAPPFIAANVLMSAWIVAFTSDQPILALAILALTLVTAIVMYRRVTAALTVGPQRRAWLAPFSLFLGWISVATIANTTIAFVATGADPKSVPLGLAMLGVTVGLGLLMAVRFRDVVFPLVIAWATMALAIRGLSVSPLFAGLAILGSVVSILASTVLVILRVEQTFGLGVPIAPSPTEWQPQSSGRSYAATMAAARSA